MALHDDIALKNLGNGSFSAEIVDSYWIVTGPNGGYLAALLVNAGELHVSKTSHQLRSFTTHYLTPPKLGQVEISVQTIRSGRSVDFLRLEMTQGDTPVLLATGAWAVGNETGIPPKLEMPSAPLPESCPAPARLTEKPARLHEQWDIRQVDPNLLVESSPDSDNKISATWWIRPAEETSMTSALVVAISDALPPPIFFSSAEVSLVPTINLTVHIRSELDSVSWDPDTWILANFATRHASQGFLEEDGVLWHQDGTLLAMSRQLSLAR